MLDSSTESVLDKSSARPPLTTHAQDKSAFLQLLPFLHSLGAARHTRVDTVDTAVDTSFFRHRHRLLGVQSSEQLLEAGQSCGCAPCCRRCSRFPLCVCVLAF